MAKLKDSNDAFVSAAVVLRTDEDDTDDDVVSPEAQA